MKIWTKSELVVIMSFFTPLLILTIEEGFEMET